MTGFNETRLNPLGHTHGPVIRDRLKTLNYLLRMLLGVEWFEGWFAGTLALAVLSLGITGLDSSRIAQDESGHVDGGRCGKDRRAMSTLAQQWQATGMVKMTVREQNRIEPLLGSGRRPVKRLCLFAALKH